MIEVLVAVTLLSLIVIGLLMMFNQTQSVFRGSMTQTDVLEPGRAATDFLARELEQANASYLNATNFYVGISPYNPVLQALPPASAGTSRTNVLEQLFFLTCLNRQWNAVGYWVDNPMAGVGTLKRFFCPGVNVSTNPLNPLTGLVTQAIYDDSTGAPLPTNCSVSRLIDGVVHFRVRAYDTNGFWIPGYGGYGNYGHYSHYGTNISNIYFFGQGGEFFYCFSSNALPAAVEMEIGILEPPVLERFNSLAANPRVARNYLANHVGGVHLFRQRIAIPTVDPGAYQ